MTTFHLEGSDSPALAGGYLSVLKDGKEIFIAGVPSPVLFADRYRETVSESDETFEDEEGNEIAVTVWSSNMGVDWSIDVSQSEGSASLKDRLDARFKANER